jgi:hypothetical protein
MISRSVFLEREKFRTNVEQKIKIHCVFNIVFFSENRAVYDMMWKNAVQPERPQMKI